MKKIIIPALAVLAALTFNSTASALGIGDAAPALKVSKWVKGDAVASLETNKIYVVEFWATWCGPCRASIPHLTEMAHTFTNATFIGVDVWENGADKDATVAKFVRQMGDKMDYHVAMDTEDAFMADNWMKAAEQNGIPAAFLIQNGKILWIGHPMGGLEGTLKDVTAGTFDPEKAKKRAEAMKKVEAFYEKAMQGGDEAELAKEGKELEALDKELGGINPSEPFNAEEVLKQAKFQTAMHAYQNAMLSGNDQDMITNLEAVARAATPKGMDFDEINAQMKKYLANAKEAQKAMALFNKYSQAVGEDGDTNKAAAFAKQIEDLNLKSPEVLNEIAWAILTDENIKTRDVPLATRLAKAGVDASGGKDSPVLDTYARALFDGGNVSEAIIFENKAIAASKDETEKAELQATLKKYQAAAPKGKPADDKTK